MSGEYWVCGQSIQRLGMFAKWPGDKPKIPWHADFSGYRGTLTPEQLLGAFSKALSWWVEAAEISLPMVQTAGEALARMHFARIDGPSGILAYSELADNTNQPKTQRYDNSELWTLEWFLPAVIAHEWGHMFGLEHDSPTSNTLMAPFIQEDVKKPTPRDIQRLIGLGYKRRTTPIPDPDPIPVPANMIRLKTAKMAGEHGDFVLGSNLAAGDYLVLLGGAGDPPPVP